MYQLVNKSLKRIHNMFPNLKHTMSGDEKILWMEKKNCASHSKIFLMKIIVMESETLTCFHFSLSSHCLPPGGGL